MLLLFDFKCGSCGQVEEHLVERTTKTICHLGKNCGGTMTRQISPVRCSLDGTDSGFPDAHDAWARQHERRGGVSEQTLAELNGET